MKRSAMWGRQNSLTSILYMIFAFAYNVPCPIPIPFSSAEIIVQKIQVEESGIQRSQITKRLVLSASVALHQRNADEKCTLDTRD